jgi:hypothetical protein
MGHPENDNFKFFVPMNNVGEGFLVMVLYCGGIEGVPSECTIVRTVG